MAESATATTTTETEVRRKKKRHWLAWLLVFLVIGVLLLPLLHKPAPPQFGGPPMGGGASVNVEQVQQGPMDIFLDALGTVTPLQTVNVYSQVSGRVLSVNYREGQMVEKGQSLVEIDPQPTEAQLKQAQGSLTRDTATLEQDRINLKRYQDAYAQKAIPQQTVFDQEAAVRQAEGTVQNDEGLVQYYKVQLSYCHIVAPISGRIGLRLIDPGNTIFSGSSSTIATITQLNPITTVFSIAEDHMPAVQRQIAAQKSGLTVDLYDRSQANKLATGKLLTFDNQVDTSTGTVRLRAEFENKDRALFPNQFVNARLEVNRLENAKIISTAAVQYNGQQAFVYTVDKEDKVHLQNITVVNTEGAKSAIEGLNVGDLVVTSNFDRIQDGAQVSIAGAPHANAGKRPAR
ncbi:efflux RND transporter periplasmic adaptor subunit [Terriglobus albidus]|uniref:efflux RND transporter periplasmic adaptor subunit n=1 Tax=Terriglobus albidus TaxID=1592106 RepID=UPI0021E09CCE|nr:efflux RND transporter periplasmic adaptor subunit [Terriglobus albidus]